MVSKALGTFRSTSHTLHLMGFGSVRFVGSNPRGELVKAVAFFWGMGDLPPLMTESLFHGYIFTPTDLGSFSHPLLIWKCHGS